MGFLTDSLKKQAAFKLDSIGKGVGILDPAINTMNKGNRVIQNAFEKKYKPPMEAAPKPAPWPKDSNPPNWSGVQD